MGRVQRVGVSSSGRIGFGYWKKLWVRVRVRIGFGYWHRIFPNRVLSGIENLDRVFFVYIRDKVFFLGSTMVLAALGRWTLVHVWLVQPMCWNYLPANVYILPICIVAGALSIFYMRREDVCLISVQWSVSRNTVPWGVFPNTLPREQGVYWIIWSLNIMLFNIIPVASEYQEIHPYGVVNIDNVKINTTMMR